MKNFNPAGFFKYKIETSDTRAKYQNTQRYSDSFITNLVSNKGQTKKHQNDFDVLKYLIRKAKYTGKLSRQLRYDDIRKFMDTSVSDKTLYRSINRLEEKNLVSKRVTTQKNDNGGFSRTAYITLNIDLINQKWNKRKQKIYAIKKAYEKKGGVC